MDSTNKLEIFDPIHKKIPTARSYKLYRNSKALITLRANMCLGCRLVWRASPIRSVTTILPLIFWVLNEFLGYSLVSQSVSTAGDSLRRNKGKFRSLVLAGDSFRRYSGREVRRRVRGNYVFPGAGVRKEGESVEGLVDGNGVVCSTVGGNHIQGRRSAELIRLYRQVLVNVRDKDATDVACGILPTMGYGGEWMSRVTGFN